MRKIGYLMYVLLVFLVGCSYGYLPPEPYDVPVPQEVPVDVVDEIVEEIEEESIPEKLDTDKLHWANMPVTYSVVNEQECGSYETNKINRAFNEVSNATKGAVLFERVDGHANIEVSCSFLEDCYEKFTDIDDVTNSVTRYESICAHNRGVAQFIYIGNEIKNASINLVGLAGFSEQTRQGPSGFYIGTCGHINTEVHEILHTFGYGHVNDTRSIMYPTGDTVGLTIRKQGKCQESKKEIDKDIVKDLIDTYANG
jgi:hypothetical protein